ncbi:TIR domain-containing protein [Kitasatospora purpeofusca]|uniref:WD40 domain-containing protein n=1 Tax=Kitasatospora purpeofusca TaxID=67352 RepID=UPI0038636070|nr:TIR domain-containing protein [Kitasatospora purpeofusca]
MGALDAIPGGPGPIDFFISYSPADERWAAWIAWTLEEAGYRAFLQAWDFVPGTNFVDFMDRGITESAAVIALLSRNYERSRYGRMEWQAALRADPDEPERRLVTVRIEDIPVDGLLATLTYIDLVGVTEPDRARGLLLTRVAQAMEGRARPELSPGYPGNGNGPAAGTGTGAGSAQDLAPAPRPGGDTGRAGRRRPSARPEYPQAAGRAAGREAVSVLHLAGPAFGRGADPVDLQAALWGDLVELADAGAPAPELVVVTGDLTATGSPRECEQALTFLTGIRSLLGLEPHRVAVLPGGQDVNQAASRAYFATCEADELRPAAPYWPKWRHYSRLFQEFYQGLDVVFDSAQPWTLFPVPELGTVVAGLNSSMAWTHRPEDRYGWLGPEQAAWFAQALRPYENDGWLRIGAVRHPVATGQAGRAGQPGQAGHTVGGTGPGTAGGVEPLRDADRFTRLTAPRLHLLLHGPAATAADGPGRGPAARPLAPHLLPTSAGELPVLGATAPGAHQLLRLTRDGLTRWPASAPTTPGPTASPTAGPTAGPHRLTVAWRRAERAFPAPAPSPRSGPPQLEESRAPADTDHETRALASPQEALLARVAEVCRTRHPGAQIRPVAGTTTQLFVTWAESGLVRQQRVAACVGTPTEQEVEQFVDAVHADGAGLDAELVHDGPPPSRELRDRARRRGVRLRSFLEFQGLLDLRGYVGAQTERLSTDSQYHPDLYLAQRYRDAERPATDEREGLVDELLRLLDSDHGRFVLLLGDFGRGKTFALRELARRLPAELPHLAPLFIELSALDKAHSLDGLVAAHLTEHGIDTLDLRAFRYMLRQGRVVLLFDGFDELVNRVSYERAADHLQVLLDAAVDNAKIVVTSRTQHFSSHEQVLTALGERVGLLPQRRLIAVQDFTPHQIRGYLGNRYGDEETAARRMRLLEAVPDLLALCRNPRLLSFVADLDHDRLRAVAGAGRALSAAGLYEEVFTSWLRFEERRGHGGPGAAPGLQLDQLWQAVTLLALRLWESGRSSIPLDEIVDIAGVLNGLADNRMPTPQVAHAVGSGSLLVRSDEGMFHFIHGSVGEWLVARAAAEALARADTTLLARGPLSRLAVEFLCDLADHQACQQWARSVLDAPETATEAARLNAVKVLDRLRVPAHTDLRGATLAGEDLSHRDLSGVDLFGADLRGARLLGANLSGADLRGARLAGARLDSADLTGADLRFADLRGARLVRTDLRGARLRGSHWQRAALISAVTDEEVLAAPELRAAAIAPGLPVEAGFSPSEVGVPYGFDVRSTRLPEPVAFSRDGHLLAVGSEDGSVLICDAVTGIALRTLKDHIGRVYSVKFADDVLATGSADGTVRLWDPVSGECRHRLDVHPGGVWPLSLARDGRLVATGDLNGVVTLWDTVTGEPRHRLPGHAAPVYTAVFSPDGALLVTGDQRGGGRLWSTANGRRLAELPGHRGTLYRSAFSPDGTLVATADGGPDDGTGGTVRIWEVASRRLRHTMPGHAGRIYTLAFHPDGDLLASGDTEGRIRLWNPLDGTSAGRPEDSTGKIYQVTFDEAGTRFAASDSDGGVRVWRVGPADGTGGAREVTPLRRQPPEHRGSVWACRFRPGSGRGGAESDPLLVTGANDGRVRLWDPASGRSRQLLRGHGRRIGSLTFSGDGSLLAAGGNDGRVRLWEPSTGRRLRELSGRSSRLVSAVFSPEEAVLATATNDGDLCLWNARTGEYLREMDVETEHVWAEAFSADGVLVATANDDDTVRIWYRRTGAHLNTLREHRGRVRSIAFSPDGRQLLTGCDDSRVRISDLAAGRVVAELDGHTDRVYAVSPAADSTWLASASWDGTAVIWVDRAVRHRLTGHVGRLWTAAAHPRRPLLATAGDDRVVRLWDPLAGTEVAGLRGHTGRILAVTFSPDGSLLASGGEDGTIRLWRVPEQGRPTALATLLGTPDGWAALLPSGAYKCEGDVAGEFWHAVGMCRFEPGELDSHLPGVHRLSPEALL